MQKAPKFKTAKEESEFWETHSPLDFPGEFEDVKEPIIDQRGRMKGIYIRVDPEAIELARRLGAKLGLGYQTLFRMWIMEGLGRYWRAPGPTTTTLHEELAAMLAELPPEWLLRLLRQIEQCEVPSPEMGYHGVRQPPVTEQRR